MRSYKKKIVARPKKNPLRPRLKAMGFCRSSCRINTLNQHATILHDRLSELTYTVNEFVPPRVKLLPKAAPLDRTLLPSAQTRHFLPAPPAGARLSPGAPGARVIGPLSLRGSSVLQHFSDMSLPYPNLVQPITETLRISLQRI